MENQTRILSLESSKKTSDKVPVRVLSLDLGKVNLGWCMMCCDLKGIEGLDDSKSKLPKGTTVLTPHVVNFDLFNIDSKLKTKAFKNVPVCISRPTILIEFLDDLYSRYQFNKVVVEKQNINNPLAMNLQTCIITYCLIKNITVVSYDPKKKFNNASTHFNTTVDSITQLNTSKKEHKKIVQNYAMEVISKTSFVTQDELVSKTSYTTQNDLKQVSDDTSCYLTREELVRKFNTFSKKDDISDAIVQAYLSEVV